MELHNRDIFPAGAAQSLDRRVDRLNQIGVGQVGTGVAGVGVESSRVRRESCNGIAEYRIACQDTTEPASITVTCRKNPAGVNAVCRREVGNESLDEADVVNEAVCTTWCPRRI
jgi:hypothetical protein